MSVSTKQLDKILDSHDQAMKALETADKKKTAELKAHFADLDDLLGRMAKKRGQDGDIIADALAAIAKKDSERAARLSKIVGGSKKKAE